MRRVKLLVTAVDVGSGTITGMGQTRQRRDPKLLARLPEGNDPETLIRSCLPDIIGKFRDGPVGYPGRWYVHVTDATFFEAIEDVGFPDDDNVMHFDRMLWAAWANTIRADGTFDDGRLQMLDALERYVEQDRVPDHFLTAPGTLDPDSYPTPLDWARGEWRTALQAPVSQLAGVWEAHARAQVTNTTGWLVLFDEPDEAALCDPTHPVRSILTMFQPAFSSNQRRILVQVPELVGRWIIKCRANVGGTPIRAGWRNDLGAQPLSPAVATLALDLWAPGADNPFTFERNNTQPDSLRPDSLQRGAPQPDLLATLVGAVETAKHLQA